MEIRYQKDLTGVDWEGMRETLNEDHFDNGRTPEQYRLSFENSYRVVLAYDGSRLIGTARVISDGICNAYVVDVWTHSDYRRNGIGRKLMNLLVEDLWGQHVYLFTDDQAEFYRSLGYQERGLGFELVRGQWLANRPVEQGEQDAS